MATFGDIAKGFDYGMNAAAKSFDGNNKYIRITDIDEVSSQYLYDDVVSPDGELEDRYLVKENDILLARTGASTGKAIFTAIVMVSYILPDFLYVQIFISTIHILCFPNCIHFDIRNGFL